MRVINLYTIRKLTSDWQFKKNKITEKYFVTYKSYKHICVIFAHNYHPCTGSDYMVAWVFVVPLWKTGVKVLGSWTASHLDIMMVPLPIFNLVVYWSWFGHQKRTHMIVHYSGLWNSLKLEPSNYVKSALWPVPYAPAYGINRQSY